MFALGAGVFLLGWLVAFPLLNQLGPWVVVAGAPVMGWFLTGVIAFGSLWGGFGITPIGIAVVVAVVAAVLWLSMRPRFLWQEHAWPFLSQFLFFSAVGAFAEYMDLHAFVPDSLTFTLLGKWAAENHGFTPAMASALMDLGALPLAWQSLAKSLYVDYVYWVGPCLTGSLLVSLWILGGRLWESVTADVRTRRQAALLACAWIGSTPLFFVQAETIHSILPASLFTLWFVLSMLLYLQERRGQWLVAAFLGLCGLTLSRVEAPLFAALFLAIFFSDERISSRYFARLFHPYAALTVAFYVFLAYHFQPHFDAILDPERVGMVLAPLALLFVFTAIYPMAPDRLSVLRAWLGTVALVLSGLALTGFLFLRPSHLGMSAFWTMFNLIQTGLWGYSALALVAVFFFVFRGPRLAWEGPIWKVLLAATVLIFLLSVARLPYRPNAWDVGNRLFWQFFPLALVAVMGRWCVPSSSR